MARAKPKKWAAESLVSETESKAIASPEQQRMAGELTAEMLLMMSPVPGGKKLLNLVKKAFKGKGKGKAAKGSGERGWRILDHYKKAHPRTSGKKAKGGSVKKYARGGGVRKARF
jgi:hypothetical protein